MYGTETGICFDANFYTVREREILSSVFLQRDGTGARFLSRPVLVRKFLLVQSSEDFGFCFHKCSNSILQNSANCKGAVRKAGLSLIWPSILSSSREIGGNRYRGLDHCLMMTVDHHFS